MQPRLFTRLNLVLIVFTAISIGLLIGRLYISGSPRYLFLVWNLFLAAIPLCASTFVAPWANRKKPLYSLLPILGLWLLFLPNAPYIITDLYHLKPIAPVPMWFDILLLFSFAWIGLMMGIVSMKNIHQMIANRYNAMIGWIIIVTSSFLSGFGIYLGRFERWNSWEIVTNFKPLCLTIISKITHPMSNPRLVGVTLIFGVLITVIYAVNHYLNSETSDYHP